MSDNAVGALALVCTTLVVIAFVGQVTSCAKATLLECLKNNPNNGQVCRGL